MIYKFQEIKVSGEPKGRVEKKKNFFWYQLGLSVDSFVLAVKICFFCQELMPDTSGQQLF